MRYLGDTPHPSWVPYSGEGPARGPHWSTQTQYKRPRRTTGHSQSTRNGDQWIFGPQLDAVISASRQDEDEDDEDQRGGSLLEFTLEPTGPRRRWRNVLNKQRHQARLRQTREATFRDDLGHEVTQALRRALLRQIDTDSTLTLDSTLHFTMQSRAFDHAFQSATFRVREVQEDSERLSTYLQTLAQNLNSNQAFTSDDTFDLETTFIHTPGRGRGHGKRYKPASAAV